LTLLSSLIYYWITTYPNFQRIQKKEKQNGIGLTIKQGTIAYLGNKYPKKEGTVKRLIITISSIVLITAVIIVGCTSVESEKITVMNPAITSKMVDRIPLTNRLDSLEGKTLYMVDIGWGGPDAAYSVFEEMQGWFSENMPSVKTVLKRKQGPYSADDPELWKEIKEKGHAAIIGISG
jgi:hypothetical protein